MKPALVKGSKSLGRRLEIVVVRQLGIGVGFSSAIACRCGPRRFEIKVFHYTAHIRVSRDSDLCCAKTHESSAALCSILKSSSDSESSVIFFFGFAVVAGLAFAVPFAALPLTALAVAMAGFNSSLS